VVLNAQTDMSAEMSGHFGNI